ncbi:MULTISPECIES: hypothetical protein [unclassified Streptomyces]|uniref:hypothetical protein n=1 Tax=unclassified Streptomyces TaxID=2593676 RepID=UPI0033B184C8
MRFRGKSIRRKIVALLLVPLVSLPFDVGYIVEKVGYLGSPEFPAWTASGVWCRLHRVVRSAGARAVQRWL